MQMNARGLALLKSFEKCAFVGYLPTPDDKPTIGWGHCGPEVHVGLVWTQEQCDAQLEADLAWRERTLTDLLLGIPTTGDQFSAMCSLAYNIGFGDATTVPPFPGFSTSTVLRRHKLRNYSGAADAFLMWNKQKGRVLPGLTRRRAAERLLYLGESA
jgi:lysozyme